jgi:formate dehydrogenase subunit delta
MKSVDNSRPKLKPKPKPKPKPNTMNPKTLITMANQIGEFFASMPDRAQAQANIADHIRRYWDPRMRRAILAALDDEAEATATLLPIVREALTKSRDVLIPVTANY